MVSIPGAVNAWTVANATLLATTSVNVSVLNVPLDGGPLDVRRQGSMPGWRMPLWPLPPLLVIGAIGYALLGSAPVDLWITAGIVVVALVYYAGYLAPRRGDRFVVQAPVEE